MRFVIGLVLLALIAAGGYCGYWFYAAGQIEERTLDWMTERQADGWDVSETVAGVSGFPGAHVITLTDLDITAPPADGGWSMSAARMDVEAAAPWNFESWTVYPAREVVIRPAEGEPVRLSADSSRLELDTENGVISSFYAEAHNVGFAARNATLEGAESLFAQGQRSGGVWRVQFESREAVVAENGFGDASAAFGAEVQLLALDVQVGEQGLAALAAGGSGLADAGDLTINAARLEWGAADMSGEGALGVTQTGRLRGHFDVAVGDASAFLGALAGASIIPPGMANVALAATVMLPRDDEGRAILPFTFQNGETKLGPVRIGPAPVLFEPEA